MGADGLIVEVHPNPAEALSDGAQQIDFAGIRQLVEKLQPFASAVQRAI